MPAFPDSLQTIRIFFAVTGALVCFSCQSTARKSGDPDINISEQELKQKMEAMASNFKSRIEIDAMRVSSKTRDNEVRRRTLYMKMKTVTAIETATDHPSSLTAYFDLWVLAYQMERYLETRLKDPEADEATRELATGLVEAYNEWRLSFEEVAKTFIPPESYDETVQSVAEYVKSYGITDSEGAINRVSFSESAVGSVLSPVLSMTMSPFRAMEGVGKAGDASEDIVSVAKRITRIAERLPEHLGWEMEGLLLNVRRDVDEILESLDEKQGALQGTLREVQVSLSTVDRIAERTEGIAASVDHTVATLDSTTSSIESLLHAYRDTMMTLYPPKTPEEMEREAAEGVDAPETESKPFDINEYTATLAELTAASIQLQGLLIEVQATLDGDSLERVVEGVGMATSAALAESTRSVDEILDTVTRRIIQLLLLAFALAVIFLILSRWVIRRKMP